MNSSTKRIKQIVEKNGLKLELKYFESDLKRLVERSERSFSKDQNSKQNRIAYLLSLGVCKKLMVGGTKEEMPEWAKREIKFRFLKYNALIMAEYEKTEETERFILEKIEAGEDFGKMISENQKKEYQLKKTFHEKEAKKYLVDLVETKLTKAVEKINIEYDYKKMVKELYQELESQYFSEKDILLKKIK